MLAICCRQEQTAGVDSMAQGTGKRRREWGALAFILGAAWAGIGLVTWHSITSSYDEFEKQEAVKAATDAAHNLSQPINEIHTKCMDWAHWTGLYNYVLKPDPVFEEENIGPESADVLELDALVILNNRLKVQSKDEGTGAGLLDPDKLAAGLREQGFFQNESVKTDGWSGVVLIQERPILVSVRRIRNSEGSGPPAGWIAMAVVAGQEVESRLSEMGGSRVNLIPLSPVSTEGFLAKVPARQAFVSETQEDWVVLRAWVPGLSGKPAVGVQTWFSRRIHGHGQKVLRYVLSSLGLIGLCFSAVLVWLFSQLDRKAAKLAEQEAQLRQHNTELESTVASRTQEIRRQALYDRLTGIPNRLLFSEKLASVLEEPEGRGVALFFLDLDNFKAVNDTLGHGAGDQLLTQVAQRLVHAVGRSAMVARLGGDEFTLLASGLQDEDQAEVIAQRALQALRAPFDLSGEEVMAGGSIGVVTDFSGVLDAEEMMRRADMAMYEAKRNGKGAYAVYDSGLGQDHLERMQLEADLRTALDHGGISVHYQPVVDASTGRIVGAEALARWTHPSKGSIPPSIFIPAAESCGLICALGMDVLKQACRQAAAWRTTHGPDFYMSVNLSARQLQDEALVFQVARLLKECGLPGSSLKLEITESMLVDDTAANRSKLAALKALGIRLALDDFGTGYSSLGLLSSCPIDVIKIDRSFVSQLGKKKGAEGILGAICSIAESLDMVVICEGVETREELAFLVGVGCKFCQGYLFGRPAHSDEFGLDLLDLAA